MKRRSKRHAALDATASRSARARQHESEDEPMSDHIDTTRLTNEVGNPVADNNHTLTAGSAAP